METDRIIIDKMMAGFKSSFSDLYVTRINSPGRSKYELIRVKKSDGKDIDFEMDYKIKVYEKLPDMIDYMVEHAIKSVESYILEQKIDKTDFESVKHFIVPIIRNKEYKLPPSNYGVPKEDFFGDCVMYFAFHTHDELTIINAKHLENWGISEEDLKTVSMQNVLLLDDMLHYYTGNIVEAERAAILFGENLLTSMIFDPSYIEHTVSSFGFKGKLVVGVSNRNIMMVSEYRDNMPLEKLKSLLAGLCETKPHPVSKQLYIVDNGEISLFE